MTKITSNRSKLSRITAIFTLFAFISLNMAVPATYAASTLNLPAAGEMVLLSKEANPPLLIGVKVYPDEPLRFDFVINPGDAENNDSQIKTETEKMIKYFMASLAVPEDDLWVNLSPYEGNRIIPQNFSLTEMGRDLLAQDYLLKQLSSSLMHPDLTLGHQFWKRVYQKMYEEYGTTEIPANTFNKVWIVPSKAKVYIKDETAFVVDSYLEVMLEEDYLAKDKKSAEIFEENKTLYEEDYDELSKVSSEAIREVIIPEIEKEVNNGEHFQKLRQIYNALILATWYKRNLKESLLSKVYVEQNKVDGINVDDPTEKEKIYKQYLKTVQDGVYNYIREDFDEYTQSAIERRYFAGGAPLLDIARVYRQSDVVAPQDKGAFTQKLEKTLVAQALLNPVRAAGTDDEVGTDRGAFANQGRPTLKGGFFVGREKQVLLTGKFSFAVDPESDNNLERAKISAQITPTAINDFRKSLAEPEGDSVQILNALGRVSRYLAQDYSSYGDRQIGEENISDWQALLNLVKNRPKSLAVKLLESAMEGEAFSALKQAETEEQVTPELNKAVIQGFIGLAGNPDFAVQLANEVRFASYSPARTWLNSAISKGILVKGGNKKFQKKGDFDYRWRSDFYPLVDFNLAALGQIFEGVFRAPQENTFRAYEMRIEAIPLTGNDNRRKRIIKEVAETIGRLDDQVMEKMLSDILDSVQDDISYKKASIKDVEELGLELVMNSRRIYSLRPQSPGNWKRATLEVSALEFLERNVFEGRYYEMENLRRDLLGPEDFKEALEGEEPTAFVRSNPELVKDIIVTMEMMRYAVDQYNAWIQTAETLEEKEKWERVKQDGYKTWLEKAHSKDLIKAFRMMEGITKENPDPKSKEKIIPDTPARIEALVNFIAGDSRLARRFNLQGEMDPRSRDQIVTLLKNLSHKMKYAPLKPSEVSDSTETGVDKAPTIVNVTPTGTPVRVVSPREYVVVEKEESLLTERNKRESTTIETRVLARGRGDRPVKPPDVLRATTPPRTLDDIDTAERPEEIKRKFIPLNRPESFYLDRMRQARARMQAAANTAEQKRIMLRDVLPAFLISRADEQTTDSIEVEFRTASQTVGGQLQEQFYRMIELSRDPNKNKEAIQVLAQQIRENDELAQDNIYVHIQVVTRTKNDMPFSFVSMMAFNVDQVETVEIGGSSYRLLDLGSRVDILDQEVGAMGFTYTGDHHGVVLRENIRSHSRWTLLPHLNDAPFVVSEGSEIHPAYELIRAGYKRDYPGHPDAAQIQGIFASRYRSTRRHEGQHKIDEALGTHDRITDGIRKRVAQEVTAYLGSIADEDSAGQFNAPFTDLNKVVELFWSYQFERMTFLGDRYGIYEKASAEILIILGRYLDVPLTMDELRENPLDASEKILTEALKLTQMELKDLAKKVLADVMADQKAGRDYVKEPKPVVSSTPAAAQIKDAIDEARRERGRRGSGSLGRSAGDAIKGEEDDDKEKRVTIELPDWQRFVLAATLDASELLLQKKRKWLPWLAIAGLALIPGDDQRGEGGRLSFQMGLENASGGEEVRPMAKIRLGADRQEEPEPVDDSDRRITEERKTKENIVTIAAEKDWPLVLKMDKLIPDKIILTPEQDIIQRPVRIMVPSDNGQQIPVDISKILADQPEFISQDELNQAPYQEARYRLRLTQDLKSVAYLFYGDQTRSDEIFGANANKIGRLRGKLSVGTDLVVPEATVLSYTIKPGDSWGSIGQRFYGATGAQQTARLIGYNDLYHLDQPMPGRVIHVPISTGEMMDFRSRQVRQSLDRSAQTGQDKGAFTEEPVGGIDFNPEGLFIEETGDALELNADLDPQILENFDSLDIGGFTPVIFRIMPVNNLPQLWNL